MTFQHRVVAPRRYRCRCRHCRARRTLNQHPDAYQRPPKCRCGRNDGWVIDRYRDSRKEARRFTCDCDGWWFPHRRGSEGCHHHEKRIPDPDDFTPFWADQAPF